ncbi:MAG TPA: GNAT family N-acetyltransferase [Gaiellaceae bacterium]|jgi:GNAT superfamily N-acetyltransferase|nr:GNAT family N-acetyltransferase [Gaiellaceae bacterium]
MEVPEPVRRLALYPFHELPSPPDVEKVELDGAFIGINRWPNAQIVGMRGDGPSDVEATVEAAREVARERGKTILAWWVPPDQDHVAPALESAGLVNEDTPGFEAIENALALVLPPVAADVEGVEVRMTETWDDFSASLRVVERVFGMPPVTDDDLRARYDEYRHPDNPGRGFSALIDGRIVGTSYAAFGDAGVNLFGGSVLPEARGRGVYRALVQARWKAASDRGTPALTVQASRMSRPICERLGFVFLAPVRVFVDQL